jgi:alpha-amylase/alpha-mannosidase (GH57 family)
VALHGHFYQPPRENPWLDAVEVEPSAAPFHDWNERITAECYAPNTAARRVDAQNRILDVVNNFEKISFDIGPTLMSWLERHQPRVYDKILEADRQSLETRAGHGNAIAQAFNHVIMPLASRRDKVTQVRWGLEDFRHRYGRRPEGMWLPETAADAESLEVLAEAGITFTILAPHQARRVRALGTENWQDTSEPIDPTRAYHWRAPGGLPLALFFYDGAISRSIAFGDALTRGEVLAERLGGGLSGTRTWPQLVHCATDGESYGHHSKFGDMALAAAVAQVEREGTASFANYGQFLAANPPTHEVEIHENTSWSCAHGVERWRSDCGCRTRGDWHQRWRGPLRDALDWLRDQVDVLYEVRAAAWFKHPWEARDEYIRIILDRSPEARADFFARHQRRPDDEQVTALRLLELERQRLLMYTSCGWFFDEISGLEAVQVLKYAAMAIQYVRRLGGGALEDEFVRRLARAPSNIPEFADGAQVYRRLVRRSVVDTRRVVAHYAISSRFEVFGEETRIYAFSVRRIDEQQDADSTSALRIGHVSVRSEVTGEAEEAMYALLHHGGHDFHCGVRPFVDESTYAEMKADLARRYARGSLSDVVRALDQRFPGESYSLEHLFLDERRQIFGRLTDALLEREASTYQRIWEEHRKLIGSLREADAIVPDVLNAVARHVLARQITAELSQVGVLGVPDRAFGLLEEAKSLGIALDLGAAAPLMRQAVASAMEALAADPSSVGVRVAMRLIDGARRLTVDFGLWQAQTRFFEIWRTQPDARSVLGPLGDQLGYALPD